MLHLKRFIESTRAMDSTSFDETVFQGPSSAVLKSFVAITGTPLANFDDKKVTELLPVPPKSATVPVRSPTGSVFVVCHFEEVARSHSSVSVRHLAGAGGIAHKLCNAWDRSTTDGGRQETPGAPV